MLPITYKDIDMALEDIQRMQMVQGVAKSPKTMDDMQMIRGRQGLQAPPSAPQGLQGVPPQGARRSIMRGMSPRPMGGQALIPVPIPKQPVQRPPEPNEIKEGAFNAAFEHLAKRAGVNLITPIKEVIEVAEMQTTSEAVPPQRGLINRAMGGRFEGRVPGDGHGMEDNVYMPIQNEGEQVGTLAVSPKEYVVDAHTMSALGNGNADKGADVMDTVVENIREKAYGTNQQPNEINGLQALRPMIERV